MALIMLGVFMHFYCAATVVPTITMDNRIDYDIRSSNFSVQANMQHDAALADTSLVEYDVPIQTSTLFSWSGDGKKVRSIISSPWFCGWILGLFSTWAALASFFSTLPVFEEKPFFAAHQVTVVIPSAFLASYGAWMWFFDNNFDAAFRQDKIYGTYSPAATLVTVMFVFQVWDWFTTLVMSTEVEGQVQHVLHHIATAAVCAIGLLNGDHGFLLIYAPFFIGLSEASSVPLAVMDFFKHFQNISKVRPITYKAARATFAVLFLSIRCCYWPLVAADLCATTLDASSPLSFWMKIVVNVFNFGLLQVQLYWGRLLVKAEIQSLMAGPTASSAQKHDSGLVPIASMSMEFV